MATRRVSRGRGRPARSRPAPAVDVDVSLRYVETSALVGALLERDAEAQLALRASGRRVTSALTFAEAARAVIRARATGRLSDAQERAAVRALHVFERRIDVVGVTDAILQRVRRRFPIEPVRTLDAVHLATADVIAESPQLITIITRDERVSANARALGHPVE